MPEINTNASASHNVTLCQQFRGLLTKKIPRKTQFTKILGKAKSEEAEDSSGDVDDKPDTQREKKL